MPDPPGELVLGPGDLGFQGDAASGWVRDCRGVPIHFHLLQTIDEMSEAERLQTEVFGLNERDLVAGSELVAVRETGGAVIVAATTARGPAVGVVIGWGGFVNRAPRIVSDFMAVSPAVRNLGIGAQLKRLQAALAIEAGFREIVWTVDPLRAANARLNFNKLGAIADHYEENRYGAEFATPLYGGMPTDRLHLTWRIGSAATRRRLLADEPPSIPEAVLTAPATDQPVRVGGVLLAPLPPDIDRLLATDPAAAIAWRFRTRETLQTAFANQFVITGFRPAGADPAVGPALILEPAVHAGHPDD